MRYVILVDPNNFLLEPDGHITVFTRFNDARSRAGAKEVIVPIANDVNVEDYETGKLRIPIFNRSGLRD